ncbi:hypothetical protein ACVWYN_000420 [Pedobacter sp. UYP24]
MLAFFFIWFTSCTSDKGDENYVFHKIVNSSFITKKFTQADELIDKTEFVKLETNPNSLLGKIDRVEQIENSFLLYDSKNKLILRFDRSGKFLNPIGKEGHCLECYTKIDYFTINRSKRQVLIMDMAIQKILVFNLDGKFLSKSDLPQVYPAAFAISGDKYVYFQNKSTSLNGGTNYHDLLIMKQDVVLNQYFKHNSDYKSWFDGESYLYYRNDTVNYVNLWAGEVFALANDSIIPRYKIDFGKNKLPLQNTKNLEDFDRNQSEKFTYILTKFVEGDEAITFLYMDQKEIKRGLINKMDNTFSTIEPSEFKLSLFKPLTTYNDTYISVVEPGELLEAHKHLKDDKTITDITRDLSPTDNPILVIHNIKTFSHGSSK